VAKGVIVLSKTIKQRISLYAAGHSDGDSANTSRSAKQHRRSTTTLSQAISAKLEDGNVRAAIRILMSEDSPAVPSAESLQALRQKHPPASSSLSNLLSVQSVQCMSVHEDEVRRAVPSFPPGSAGRPDGLRPQHIRDMLMCQEAGTEFLSTLIDLVNLVVAGHCPMDVAAVFFGGCLLALSKKTGGIRPIAIGFTLRRLISKCANAFDIKKLAPYFYPHQPVVGTAGGCEAVRRYIEAMPQDHVLVKLDFTNAFNGIHKDDMLHSVYNRISELYMFCKSAYGQPSVRHFGTFTILSQEGIQQGDPLGPLLSCNIIHPTLSSLQAQLNLGYLDDISLGGSVDMVASDVAEIINVGAEIGLSLNVDKCELIAHDDIVVSDAVSQSFNHAKIEDAILLGAPLFPGPALDRAWNKHCEDLARAVGRLCAINSQDALILLRSSFSASKVLSLEMLSISRP